MKDMEKTKAQLAEELAELRGKLRLQQDMSSRNGPSPPNPSDFSILVAEENASEACAILEELQKAGFNAIPAETGHECLEKAGDNRDLAILGLRLPDMSGIEALAKLREASPGLPIIMIARALDLDTRAEALKAGADDCLIEPFHPAELLARVNNLLDRDALRVKLRREREARHNADLERQKTKSLFESLVENSTDVIVTVDTSGTVAFHGASIEKVLGYRPEERVGRNAFELIHGDDVERARELFGQIIREPGLVLTDEIRMRARDGAWLDLEITGKNLIEDSAVGKVVINARDIGRRKRAERELKESLASFESLAENSQDYIMRYDREHRHVYANSGAIAVAGKTADEYIGKTHREMGFPGELCAIWERAIDNVFRTGEPRSETFFWAGAEGDVYLDWRLFPERGDGGEVVTVLGVSRDITELKLYEKNLEERTGELFDKVKELDCLYSIAEIMERPGITLGEICRESVDILLSSLRRPESLRARISIGGDSCASPDFRETQWSMAADIMIDGRAGGAAEVFRLDGDPATLEGPFQDEERKLLKAVAERMGRAAERAEAKEERKHALIRNETLLRLNQLGEMSEKEIADFALDRIVKDTQCGFGFLGFLDEEEKAMSIHAWSREAMAECGVRDKPIHFPIDEAGIWGEAVRGRKPFVLEDYSIGHPAKKGTPGGHVGVYNYLGIPGFEGKSIVAVAGLANREGGFREIDIRHAEVLIEDMWKVIQRKRAADALAHREQLLEEVGKMAKVGGWELDLASNEVTWTRQTYRIHEIPFDYDPPLGEAINFFHPDDRPLLEEALQRAMEHGEPYDLELRFTSAKGKELFTRTMGKAVVEDGKIIRLECVFQDITEVKQALESQSRLSSMIEQSSDSVIQTDTEFNITYINPAAEKLFGWTLEEIKGKKPDFLNADPAGKEIQEEIYETLMAGKTYSGEALNQRKNGSVFHCQLKVSPLFSANGEIWGYMGNQRDISERRRAEIALKSARDRTAAILAGIADTFYSVDNDWRFTTINPAAEKAPFGRPAEEMLGKVIWDLYPGLVGTEIHRHYLEAAENHDMRHYEALSPLNSRWYEVFMKGWPGGVDVYMRDITERKAIEAERLKMQRLESIGILAGGIAHDFNNILAGVLGNLSLAKLEYAAAKDITEFIEQAEKASLRARELTKQLLTFSKGGEPLKKTSSLADLVAESAGFVLRGSNVTREIIMEDGLPDVDVDAGQIIQVLNNLLINANQAMPNGGVVKIRIQKESIGENNAPGLAPGTYLKTTVSDEGHGIPESFLEKIFDPYFTTKDEGSGLGLATSYSIVRQHGGVLSVESELGKGTSFTFYLPAAKNGEAREKGPKTSVKQKSGKILLIDDEDIVLDIASRMLDKLGYRAETAHDGAEGVELFEKARDGGAPFDAVITDLTIPGGMGGKEVASRLLEIDPKAVVIIASGYSNDPVISRHAEYGFKGVVKKPFSIGELDEILDAIAL